MQLYRGLPIITNKTTTQERNGIPHHLLGTIGLDEPTWTVGKFVGNAQKCIENIHGRGKLPIVVGGTHYYTQALLFKNGIVGEQSEPENTEKDAKSSIDQDRGVAHPILQGDTASILAKLREVDPVMADRWHPNDRRKIQRSLEIYLQTGKTASATYEEQQKARETAKVANVDGNALGGLQYPTLLLWLHCDNTILRTRLDERVDKMLTAGLLDEVAELESAHQRQVDSGDNVDPTRGIWVSIGYKEFQDYRKACAEGQTNDRDLQKSKQQAIEATQAATRQYARRQVRWIRIKLLNAMRALENAGALYLLDGSDVDRWDDNVLLVAEDLLKAFLDGADMMDPTSLSTAAAENLTPHRHDMSQRPDLWQRRECEACNAVFVTESSWEKHMKSKGHRYHLKRLQIEAGKNTVSHREKPNVESTI